MKAHRGRQRDRRRATAAGFHGQSLFWVMLETMAAKEGWLGIDLSMSGRPPVNLPSHGWTGRHGMLKKPVMVDRDAELNCLLDLGLEIDPDQPPMDGTDPMTGEPCVFFSTRSVRSQV